MVGVLALSTYTFYSQQTGYAGNCNNFYQIQLGVSCTTIESQFGITLSQFITRKPSVNRACTKTITGYYYCVGVPGATKVTTTSSTKSTGNSISTPTPVQTGMTTSCNKFYLIQSSDYYTIITTNYNLPLATFYS
ncbi:hypothetical protein ACHAPV_000742 [Trichoderma viride]